MSSTSSSVLRADQIWLDGKLCPWNEGQVHVMTHALHYGLGVFEGIRAYKTHDGRLAVFRLREHIQRLLDSAHILLLKMPYTEDELVEATLELLRKQRHLFANGAYLRPVAFMGDGAMGLGALNPTRVAITAWDWGAYLGDKGIREGIRAKVSSFTRMHVNVNMVRGKITGQYVNSILAKREAVLAGYDEAILLDISGFVAEASGENIFMMNKKGIIKTPLELNHVWPENYSANSAQKVWAAAFAAHHPNVAVLDLSSFKCGHDAPTYGLVDSILQTSKTPTAALHDLDANKPGGSIKIRVKTYAHSLRLQQERLEDLSQKKRDLELAIEKKRLSLLELKQQQLKSLKQTDARIEQQIEETRARVLAYETRRTAEVELPKGVVKLGKKNTDGQIEWVVAIIRDVTERYTREKALRARLKALEDQMRAIRL